MISSKTYNSFLFKAKPSADLICRFRSRRNRNSQKETEKPEERTSFFKRSRLIRERQKIGKDGASDSSSEAEDAGEPKRRIRLLPRRKIESEAEAPVRNGVEEQEGGGGEEYQAEDRPRVLAYSDSDSDVETHFKRVKQHLLPPSEEEKGEGEGDQSGSGGEEGGPVLSGTQADKAGTIKAGKADKPGKDASAKAVTNSAVSKSGSRVQQAQQQQAQLRPKQQTRLGSAAGAVLAGVAHHVLPHLTAGFAARVSGCRQRFL